MGALDTYMKEVGKHDLLSPEEEIELARKVQKGDKKARKRMINSNLRLVISIIKRYQHLGVHIEDLIEEGNIGLMRAVEKYDPSRGYRFSTYAAYWIRQFVTRSIADQGKTVRIPVYMNELMTKWKRISSKLTHKFGRRPRLKELADEMGLSIQKVIELKKVAKRVTSLDARVGSEDTSRLLDLIEDENTVMASDELVKFLRREKIEEALEFLDERDCKILCMRFGLRGCSPSTLQEVAKELDITRERVRQIESSALAKLNFILTSKKTNISAPVNNNHNNKNKKRKNKKCTKVTKTSKKKTTRRKKKNKR